MTDQCDHCHAHAIAVLILFGGIEHMFCSFRCMDLAVEADRATEREHEAELRRFDIGRSLLDRDPRRDPRRTVPGRDQGRGRTL